MNNNKIVFKNEKGEETTYFYKGLKME